MIRLLLYLAPLVLTLYCLVNALTSKDDEIRNLPKLAWVLLILFFPVLGSIGWLIAGRPHGPARQRTRHERPATAFPEYDRPGRAAATDSNADDAFLREVRERAEQQRRAYEQQRRAAQAQERLAEEERRRRRREKDGTEPDPT